MISLEKWKILIPLQKLPKNVGDLGKLIVATSLEKLSKVQLIVQFGHTGIKQVTNCKQKIDKMNLYRQTDINFSKFEIHSNSCPVFVVDASCFLGGDENRKLIFALLEPVRRWVEETHVGGIWTA